MLSASSILLSAHDQSLDVLKPKHACLEFHSSQGDSNSFPEDADSVMSVSINDQYSTNDEISSSVNWASYMWQQLPQPVLESHRHTTTTRKAKNDVDNMLSSTSAYQLFLVCNVVLSDKEKYYYKTVIDNKRTTSAVEITREAAIKAMVAIKLTQKGELLENIAPVLDVDVESARQYVTFFYAFREKVLKEEVRQTNQRNASEQTNRKIRSVPSSIKVVLSDKEKYYYKTVIDNMHRLPVEGYEQVSKSICVHQEVVERCVKHYFSNESKNRSPEVTEIFEKYTPKEVKTFSDEAEKLKYCNKIQARAIKAMVVINLTQKGKTLENIAPISKVNEESVREYVTFFYAFRETVLKKETIKLEASGTNQNNRTRRGLHLKVGEAKIGDLNSQMQSQAAEQFKAPNFGNAGNNSEPAAAAQDDEDVDETGVEPKDIELVTTLAMVSRSKAVRALKAAKGDIMSAILELTN
ncbi:nascent polypeptide-associated complex subunit alpha-like protein 1 [Tanacetum coccineum]